MVAMPLRISGRAWRRESRAGEGNRTPDLFITSESLCRLSYPGKGNGILPARSPLRHAARTKHKASKAVLLLPLRWVEALNPHAPSNRLRSGRS